MHRRAPVPLLPIAALGLAFFASAGPLFGANVVVDNLELVSYGNYDEATGKFPVTSRLAFDLSVGGGEKFAGLIRLNFLSTQVESDLATLQGTLPSTASLVDVITRANAPGLGIKTVAVTAKRIGGLPLDAEYFLGNLDTFCNGDDFVTLFGAAPFATELRGPLVYPEGIALNPTVSWDGIYSVYGTGARLGWRTGDRSHVYFYVYQDSNLGTGTGDWSSDLRGLVDFGAIKLESFAGGSWDPSHAYGLYRGGLLFHVAPGNLGEFFAQVGVPEWDPTTTFGVNDIFFLFEPRVDFGSSGQLALSVFYHPAYYQQKATGEGGSLDVGFNLRFGQLADSGMQGGVESYLKFKPVATHPLTASLSPYYEAILSGVAWSFKLGMNLFPFPSTWYGIFQPFVGVKTSF
ncbi:MAG TPA: hypothetical protein VMV83_10110 [Rectinemataceae bacterium]|nr:hypothetical protein [Rectinemataceae bacterium]